MMSSTSMRSEFGLLTRKTGQKHQSPRTKESETTTSLLVFLYYGVVGRLAGFDPAIWRWRNNAPLMMYIAKVGRELLADRRQLKTSIAEKWKHEQAIRFHLN